MKKIFTCLFIAALCFGKTQTLHAQVNVQDSLALVDLYNSTNGPDWNKHTNWLKKVPVSTWHGITVSNGRVTEIALGGNHLSGAIPSSLGKLSNLRKLYFQYNQLSDTIPRSLGNLIKIKNLVLGFNQLTGSIPSTLGNLTNLQYLHLGYNQLSGTIPSSLDSLSLSLSIYLHANRFTFAGMEGLVITHPNIYYILQAAIPIHQKNDGIFSVSAGGTLSNNTYKWFKDGVLVKQSIGDKNFTATGPGKYNVVVTNSICTELTLYSDTITITGFSADKNVIAKTNTKTFIYPNPANNIIHLTLDKPANSNTAIVLYNMQGKAMMQQKIAAGSLTQEYSTNNLAAGNYLLVIMENGKKIHEEWMVIVR